MSATFVTIYLEIEIIQDVSDTMTHGHGHMTCR